MSNFGIPFEALVRKKCGACAAADTMTTGADGTTTAAACASAGFAQCVKQQSKILGEGNRQFNPASAEAQELEKCYSDKGGQVQRYQMMGYQMVGYEMRKFHTRSKK